MSPEPGPEVEAEPDVAAPFEFSQRGRTILTVIWCSFLAASVATMVSFALLDPARVTARLPWADSAASHTTIYSLAFFFFWAVCAIASTLTAFMLTTPPAQPPAGHPDAVARSRP